MDRSSFLGIYENALAEFRERKKSYFFIFPKTYLSIAEPEIRVGNGLNNLK